MLGNCEKVVVVISSTTNEWPQNQIDEKSLMASTSRLMEKPRQEQQLQSQQPQQALKCPRCDSSNTKFCYYNNYSLSQPRHFCKACKRYWTRGGTLRNVPVGGGCRKNKRVKRPASATDVPSSAPTPNPNLNPPPQPHIDISSTSNHINPLFYGLPSNPSEINLPFPRFNSRVSNVDTVSGYDLHPQLNSLGLGFHHTKHIQDEATSNSLLSNYAILGSSSSSTTTSPTIASLLASSLHQRKFINGGVKDTRGPDHFQTLTPFQDLQMTGNGDSGIATMKEVKIEQGQNKFDWSALTPNQIEQIVLSDPSLYWNPTGIGAWHDPANMGSSVTSLI